MEDGKHLEDVIKLFNVKNIDADAYMGTFSVFLPIDYALLITDPVLAGKTALKEARARVHGQLEALQEILDRFEKDGRR